MIEGIREETILMKLECRRCGTLEVMALPEGNREAVKEIMLVEWKEHERSTRHKTYTIRESYTL